MASIDTVDTQVQGQINNVKQVMTDALASSETFLKTLENIGGLQPPYFIPTIQQYTPEAITIDAVAPVAPDTDSLVAGLSAGATEAFGPREIVAPADYLTPELLAQLPAIPDDAFQEGQYTSDLLDALKTRLIADVESGVTGLSAGAESAMADRYAERDAQIFADARDRMMSAWASTGFSLPDNALAALTQDLVTKEANQRLDRSREITVESFKMATENRRLAITQGVVLESALMELFNSVAERSIKYIVAKAELGVKLFLAVIDGYKANAEAKLADVRLQVESERGRIDAWIAMLSKSKMDAEIAALKLDAVVRKYGVDIQAYVAELGKGEALGRITVEQQRLVAQHYLTTFQAALQTAKDNMDTYIQTTNIKANSATAGGNIYANYIASAINSLNAVVHLASSATYTQSA